MLTKTERKNTFQQNCSQFIANRSRWQLCELTTAKKEQKLTTNNMNSKAKITLGVATALIVGFFIFRKKTTLPIISGGNSTTPNSGNYQNPPLSTNLNNGPNGLLSILTKIQSKPTGAKVYRESDKSLLFDYPGGISLGLIKNYSPDLKFYVFEASVNNVQTNLLVGVNDVELYVRKPRL